MRWCTQKQPLLTGTCVIIQAQALPNLAHNDEQVMGLCVTVGETGRVGLCAHVHVWLPVPVYTACSGSMHVRFCSWVHVVHIYAHVHLHTNTCVCAFAWLTMPVHTHISVHEHTGGGHRSPWLLQGPLS